jgi:hypothetical protein
MAFLKTEVAMMNHEGALNFQRPFALIALIRVLLSCAAFSFENLRYSSAALGNTFLDQARARLALSPVT